MSRGAKRALVLLLALSFGLGLAGTLLAAEIKPDVVIKASAENLSKGNLDPGLKPIATVKPGQIVQMETVSVVAWPSGTTADPEAYLKKMGVSPDTPVYMQIIDAIKVPGSGHILTGPVFVEGAEPGDVLEFRFLNVECRTPFAMNSERAGRGGLTVPGVKAHSGNIMVSLDLGRGVGIIAPGIEVPLKPFMGTFGLATKVKSPVTPPWPSGGNMDLKDITAGSSLYLPVQVAGGLIFTGDGHAAQGNGEICGTGLETSLTVTFQVLLQKAKFIRWPMAETATHWIITGMDADLDEALRICLKETVDFLTFQKELTPYQALCIASAACDFAVTQYANQPAVGIHCYIPRSIFVNEKNDFWTLTAAK